MGAKAPAPRNACLWRLQSAVRDGAGVSEGACGERTIYFSLKKRAARNAALQGACIRS